MGAGSLVDGLRVEWDGKMDARVRLYTEQRTDGPGARPIITWEPEPVETWGALLTASEGGVNIRADQNVPVGDAVLVLPEGADVVAGQRATVERQDRAERLVKRAVAVKRVLPYGDGDVVTRCLCTELTDGWWPDGA